MINDNSILDYDTIFFQGVVESRNDPLKLGRVKVRIIGLHTDNLQLLSLDDLPWACILIPASDSAPGGMGISVSGIPPGTHVFGVFLDGVNRQMPLVMGSIKGIPAQAERSPNRAGADTGSDNSGSNLYAQEQEEMELGVDFRKGFFDPHEEMLSGHPRPNRTNQQDVHPLLRVSGASGSPEKNHETEKPKNKIVNCRTGRDRYKESDVIWEEPSSRKNTIYPHNRIYESESGIGSEIDDTPYSEREQFFFTPGTNYIDWSTRDGYEFKRVWGSSYTVKHSAVDKTFVWGSKIDTILGKASTIHAKEKSDEIYDRHVHTVYDTQKIRTFGQHNEWVGQNYIIMANNDIRITANNKMSLDVGSAYKQSFHDVHHSVYWMRQYIWNEGQVHHIRKRNYFEKTNENHFQITWFDKRDVTIVGSKHWTIAASYFISTGVCGGDFHHTIGKGSSYTRTKDDFHLIVGENEYRSAKEYHRQEEIERKKVSDKKHLTVGDANIVSIGAKQSITVGAENKILVQGDDFHVVKAGKNTSVDSAIKTECGKSSEEKIGDNKVLQIAKDLMRKCKKSVTQCEEWLAKATSKVKVVTETLDIISNAARHYMQSGALHSANDLSLKVEKNSSLVVDGDFGLHVKGILRIRADGGIKIMSEKDIVIGAIEELIIGSKKEKVRSIAKPKKITHEEKTDGFDPPKIDVVVEDLSKMDKEVPEVPEVEVPTTQFQKPEQPENPVRPQDAQLPPLPQIGDFVNNRKDWAGEDSQGE